MYPACKWLGAGTSIAFKTRVQSPDVNPRPHFHHVVQLLFVVCKKVGSTLELCRDWSKMEMYTRHGRTYLRPNVRLRPGLEFMGSDNRHEVPYLVFWCWEVGDDCGWPRSPVFMPRCEPWMDVTLIFQGNRRSLGATTLVSGVYEEDYQGR